FDYYLALTVSVEDGKVTGISNIHGSSTGNAGSPKLGPYLAENDPYIAYAVEGRSKGGSYYPGVPGQIMSRAAAGAGLDGLDAVSGATYTSVSIARAYADALAKSAAAAGVQVSAEEPSIAPAALAEPDASELPGLDMGASFVDGTYTAYAFCQDEDDPGAYSPYYIGVSITVDGGRVVELGEVFGDAQGLVDPAYKYDAAENLYYLNRAINGYGISGNHPGVVQQINAKLSAGAAVEGIDTISGATWSSRSIVEAFAAALELAKAPEEAEGDGDGSSDATAGEDAGEPAEGAQAPTEGAGSPAHEGQDPTTPAAAPAPAEDLKTEEAPDEL
ncbi:MAG: FMN-binding protein, partial [Coriobacteriales bacterium]